jgi:ribosome-associated toxin RatA of RatAB toxin-antitoxin module
MIFAPRVLPLATILLVLSLSTVRGASSQPTPVTVREADGVYHVAAVFTTSQPAAIARAVLTDYEQIPRFLPDVRASRVLERTDARVVVEQEAVARVLFFSKQVHLVLEVEEGPASIHFRDRCGRSFARYEGVWTLREENGRVKVAYQLTAKPAFDVPEFLLTRLLKRDADRMITRLQAEIAARAGATEGRLLGPGPRLDEGAVPRLPLGQASQKREGVRQRHDRAQAKGVTSAGELVLREKGPADQGVRRQIVEQALVNGDVRVDDFA